MSWSEKLAQLSLEELEARRDPRDGPMTRWLLEEAIAKKLEQSLCVAELQQARRELW